MSFYKASSRISTSIKRSNPTQFVKRVNATTTKIQKARDSSFINAPFTRGRDDLTLSRFPNMKSSGGILRGLDYAGTLTFALTGSVTAAQSGLDVFGCSLVAMVTAVGGGTIRDAIFLSRRPFWTSETEYIWMSIFMGAAAFFVWPSVTDWKNNRQMDRSKSRSPSNVELTKNEENLNCYQEEFLPHYDELDAILDSLDAIGLSAFAIIGAQNGVRAGMPMVVSAICGMATATFGGLTRDILCAKPVRIIHSNSEIYAQPALSGAVAYLAATNLKYSPGMRVCGAMAVCLSSRYIAIKHEVKLYTWETKSDGLGFFINK